MAKESQSRAARRDRAVEAASGSVGDLESVDADTGKDAIQLLLEGAAGNADSAVSDLQELYDELESWYDNLNEGLQASSTGERLEEAKDALQTAIDEFESAKSSIEGVAMDDFDAETETVIQSILDAAAELDGAIDEANNVDFPGMYGR